MNRYALLFIVLLPILVCADVWLEDGRPQEAATAAAVSVTVTNQAVGAQTPWAQDVDAAGYGLTNAARLNFGAASIAEDTNRAERPLVLSHTFAGGGGPASAGLYPWNALDGQVLAWNASAGWWLPSTPAAGAGDNLGNHVAVSNLNMNGSRVRFTGSNGDVYLDGHSDAEDQYFRIYTDMGGGREMNFRAWNAPAGQVLTSDGYSWVASNATAGAGDNLGNHTATRALDMAGFAVTNAGDIVLSAGGGVDTNFIVVTGAGSPGIDGTYTLSTPSTWTNNDASGATITTQVGPAGVLWLVMSPMGAGYIAYPGDDPSLLPFVPGGPGYGGAEPSPSLHFGGSVGALSLNPRSVGSSNDVLTSRGDGTVGWSAPDLAFHFASAGSGATATRVRLTGIFLEGANDPAANGEWRRDYVGTAYSYNQYTNCTTGYAMGQQMPGSYFDIAGDMYRTMDSGYDLVTASADGWQTGAGSGGGYPVPTNRFVYATDTVYTVRVYVSGAGTTNVNGTYVYAGTGFYDGMSSWDTAWTNQGPWGLNILGQRAGNFGAWYLNWDYSGPATDNIADVKLTPYMGGLLPTPSLDFDVQAPASLSLNPGSAGASNDVLTSSGDGTVRWVAPPSGLTTNIGYAQEQYVITNLVVSNGLIQQIDVQMISH